MIDFKNLPNTSTPLNATNMNKMQEFSFRGVASTNLNEAKQYGEYRLSGTYTNAPISSGLYGILLVYESRGSTWTPSEEESSGSSWIWQEIRTTSGAIYVRHAVNLSTSWSGWKKYILQENIKSGTTELVTAAANSYIDVQITFDKAFNDIPIVVGTLRGNATSTDNGNTLLSIMNKSTTNATFRYYNNSSTTRAMYIDWIAYGN